MWRFLNRMSGASVFSLGYLAVLFLALKLHNHGAWVTSLILIAAIAFLGWLFSYKGARQIVDLPLSRIGSAAQGYIELCGKVSIAQENMIATPFSGLSCVWYRYQVFEKHGDDWRGIDSGVSSQTIQIKDATGTCQVDPDDAMVIGSTKRTSRRDNYRYEEEILFAGFDLYVLGEFTTIGGAATELDLKKDVGDLLDSWKRDKKSLLQRFDLNKDGEIDMEEWNLARRAAVKEVTEAHRELRAEPGVHVIRAPSNHQLFLISTLSPHKLRVRFILWATLHCCVLVAASLAATFLLTGHF
jgi:hypothetical protein